MYKLFLGIYSVLGVLSLLVGAYLGLSMNGVTPIPEDLIGGWIGGLAPVALGALGITFLFMAYNTGSNLVVKSWRDVEKFQEAD